MAPTITVFVEDLSWSAEDMHLQLHWWRTAHQLRQKRAILLFVTLTVFVEDLALVVSGGHASAVTLSENTAPTATELANTFVCGTDFDQIK